MKTKKNPKYDLESKRKTFFLFGLTISLAVVLFAFKGAGEVKEIEIPTMPTIDPGIEIFIPPTAPDKPLPPPPPKLKIYDVINITEGPTIVDPNFEFPEVMDPIPDPVKITEETPETPPLLFAEKMPDFPGGMKGLNLYLSKNLNYPQKAQQLNVSGRVYLSFVVNTDGSITDVNVTRGVDPLLDEEAIRVVSAMPKWKPGIQNMVPVKVRYNLYVTFKLN